MKITLDIKPKPQSRPRFTRQGRAYEETDMTKWKEYVAYLLRSERLEKIESGPVYIGISFFIWPPLAVSKLKTKNPVPNEILETYYVDKRPDLDNYVKAILDASNEILFKDDGQIAASSSEKLYSLNPRIEIEIFKLPKFKQEQAKLSD